jgi:hypothetical protein
MNKSEILEHNANVFAENITENLSIDRILYIMDLHLDPFKSYQQIQKEAFANFIEKKFNITFEEWEGNIEIFKKYCLNNVQLI